jgi:uncharacterized protein (TIGR00297 family)
MEQLYFGFVLAVAISLLAFWLKALNLSGVIAAIILGTITFGLGGISWAIVLVAFFLSSSALSRLAGKQKSALSEKAARGSRRDAWQVLANGGVAGLIVLVYAAFARGYLHFSGNPGQVLFLSFASSLAAATADTWATELGVLSHGRPVLLTTGKPVEPGTSGGVTLQGWLAALGGATFIGIVASALLFFRVGPAEFNFTGNLYRLADLWLPLVMILGAGLTGSFIDSLLGATFQAVYYCPGCGKETEHHPIHSCGSPTNHLRGWHWLNNDLVNLVCSVCGAGVCLVFFLV